MPKQTTLEPSAPDTQSAIEVSSGGAAHQNTARNIGLITGHEYKKRVRQRSFIISTIILLVLIVIAAFVPTVIQYITAHSANSQTKITVLNNAGAIGGLNDGTLNNYINASLNGTTSSTGTTTGKSSSGNAPFVVTTTSTGSVNDLKNQVKNGKLDILLVLTRATNSADSDLQFTYYTTSTPNSDGNVSQVQALASQLNVFDKASRLGLTPAQTRSLFAPAQFSDVYLGQPQSNRSQGEIAAGYILAYAGNILIYIAVILYGMGVAMGVAEEKGSRIMEILVNAATPFQLLAGKIIGIGAAGLTQMALLVVVGIGALLLQIPLKAALLGSNTGGLNLNITGASISLLLLLLLYFILGYLVYAALYAAAGALVKRQDEVQNAVQPLTYLLVAGYIMSFFGVYSPDAPWFRIVSYIPFWSPTTMLVRVAAGGVAGWEIPLTIVLMGVAIVVFTYIAGRIYRYGILMYGQRPGLGKLFKLVRTGKAA
ncbi:MAG TPA: ABC transporter permease [Ktedonobacteraceae bacterium]|nr:ABC transporter permease [Ktedonobacteraceae bacterium]